MTTYYRHILNARQSTQWHHVNPDLAEWHRENIDDAAARVAIAAGYNEWVIFDVDETLLVHGVRADCVIGGNIGSNDRA